MIEKLNVILGGGKIDEIKKEGNMKRSEIKKTNKWVTTLIAFSIVLSWAYSPLPQFEGFFPKVNKAEALASGDGKIIYGESTGTYPMTRNWTGSFGAVGSTIVAASTIRHTIIKAGPTRDEMIVGIQTTGGVLYIQRWNGTSWSNEWNVTVGDGNLPRFDIAYERSTGDVMVAYGANVGTTNEIKYNIWNGSSWGGATNYDAVRTSGTIQAIALATVGGTSNDFAMAWGDSNLDLSANYWDGTNNVWKSEPATALSTGLDTLAAATSLTGWSFDLDFEASGELLVVWGNAAGTDILYRTRGAGQAGAWSGANSTAAAFAEQSDDLELTADPNSDYMILVHTGSDSGNDTEAGRWNGSAFPSAIDTAIPCTANTVCAIDASSDTTGAGTSGNAAGWLTDGANTFGVVTYDDANAAGVDWATYDKSADTWTLQTDCTTNCSSQPASGDDKSHRLRQNPFNDAEILGFFVDSGSDLWVKKLSLSGTTFTWADADAGTALEITVSSITGFPADFAFNRYIPPSITTLGDGTDGSNSTIGPEVSATEIDRFSLVTNTGLDTVTGLTVTLGPSGAYENIATVGIYTTGGVLLCSSSSWGSDNSVELSSCGISITTGSTDYVIEVTPKSHVNMPAVPGAAYATVATVTAITATNTTAGTDTNSATITIDNLSPGNVSGASAAVGNGQNGLAWTNPGDGDYLSTVVLRRASSAVSDIPVEGITYATTTAFGSSVVACVGNQLSCTDTGLANGTAYHYKIFAVDSRGNYSDTGVIPTGSPVTPRTVPTVTTQSASSITSTGATLNGNITATGGSNATVRGFAWGTSATMVGDTATTTENGSFGTGAFTNVSLTLVCNTTYYSRAYATNSAGTSYGAISSSFTTSTCSNPQIEQLHYRWMDQFGSESNAPYLAPEDTPLTNTFGIGDRARLRFLIKNIGTGIALNYKFRLEYSSNSCASWQSVPISETGNPHWIMEADTDTIDSSLTTNSPGLTDPTGSFISGLALTLNNETPIMSLLSGEFTELSYSIRSTKDALTTINYCFRLTNTGDSTWFTYTNQSQTTLYIPNIKKPGGGGGNSGNEGNGIGPIVLGATTIQAPKGGNDIEPGVALPLTGGGGSGGGELSLQSVPEGDIPLTEPPPEEPEPVIIPEIISGGSTGGGGDLE